MQRRQILTGMTGLAAGALLGPARARVEQPPVALVVGVSDYDYAPALPSAVLDAALIGASFMSLGFSTSMMINVSKNDFLRGLARFRTGAQDASLAVTYIAAHGTMLSGQGHIFLSDSKRLEDRVPESVILQAMNDKPRQKILFLDTCRENPIPGIAPSTGLDQYRAGIHVSYATQPNAPALDGEDGYSPYAKALQSALEVPGLHMPEINRQVRLSVLRETHGLQIPWERSSLVLPVILNSGS